MEKDLKSNKAKCARCGQTIESTPKHESVTCECGAISVDGALDMLRRTGDLSQLIELSEYHDGTRVPFEAAERPPVADEIPDDVASPPVSTKKTKLLYPKIPGSRNTFTSACLAFEKYDGTNMHWDWDRDFGWHAFGTRRDVFNLTEDGLKDFAMAHGHLLESVDVFRNTLADAIEKIFRDNPAYRDFSSLRIFTEFFGPQSFAGLHKKEDSKMLKLFDVWAEPFGMIGPKQFAKDFEHASRARVVYEGKLTGKFTDDVRAGRYGVSEGVVCKGGTGGPHIWMVKIKTDAYQARLKKAFADRWEDHWE